MLRVFNEKETKKEKEYFLKLQEDVSGIDVVVVDESGQKQTCGFVISFRPSPSGYQLMRYGTIGRDFGFRLDNEGCIMEVE